MMTFSLTTPASADLFVALTTLRVLREAEHRGVLHLGPEGVAIRDRLLALGASPNVAELVLLASCGDRMMRRELVTLCRLTAHCLDTGAWPVRPLSCDQLAAYDGEAPNDEDYDDGYDENDDDGGYGDGYGYDYGDDDDDDGPDDDGPDDDGPDGEDLLPPTPDDDEARPWAASDAFRRRATRLGYEVLRVLLRPWHRRRAVRRLLATRPPAGSGPVGHAGRRGMPSPSWTDRVAQTAPSGGLGPFGGAPAASDVRLWQ